MRVLLWSLLIAVVLVAALATGGILWRTELAEAAARRWLAHQGFGQARLEVTALTLERVEVRGLDLGDDGPSARSLTVMYQPSQVLAGRVERIDLDGLRLKLDLGSDRPLGRLQDLLAGDTGQAEAAASPSLPEVYLQDAVVTAASPHGTVDVAFDGRLHEAEDGLRATLRGKADTPYTAIEISLEATGLPQDPTIRLDARGWSDVAKVPWPASWPATPKSGRAEFHLTYDGTLPTTLPEGPQAALRQSAAAEISLSLQGADVTPYARGVDAGIEATLDVRQGEILLRLREPATAAATEVNAEALSEFGLGQDFASMLARLEQVTLSPWTEAGELLQAAYRDGEWRWDGRASLRATLGKGYASAQFAADGTHAADFAMSGITLAPLKLEAEKLRYGDVELGRLAFDGNASLDPGAMTAEGQLEVQLARLRAGPQVLENVGFDGPVVIEREGTETAVRLSKAGRLRLPEPPRTGVVDVEGPIEVTIRSGMAIMQDGTLSAELVADPGTLSGTIRRVDAPDVTASTAPGPIDLKIRQDDSLVAAAAMKGARIRVPDMKLSASELDADITYGTPDAPLARLSLGNLVHEAQPAAFAPLSVDLTVRRDGQRLTATGAAGVRGTDISVPLDLHHNLATQSGDMMFGPSTARFSPGGLQPRALSPLLRDIESAEGSVEVGGDLTWQPGGFNSGGVARIDALSFETPQARVEELSGTVTASRLIPTTTPPGQELTAKSVVAGVPLTDVRLRFQLVPDDEARPVLRVARIEGTLSDGLLYAEDLALKGLDTETDATVHVRGLSLRKLFEELDVEGLSAEGVLSGQIPLRFGGNGFVVDQGQISAESDGVIRVQIQSAKQALAGRGEQVQLMMRALENFQYKELKATLNRPSDGDLELGIVMEGRNPDVLDGYPFRFNINLTGDIEPLLAALQEGRRLTTELLERAVELE
ncbi:intermembrane phospholipid transport protein YdbH family protein [Ferruginivarius sediminum]|uniref:Uncharacterized protein n=1 Tax=Ferruginivarius sediminum TaxID=2661937 RepID=A0A369TGX0_9PROT|nr:YdbH domain-containing protein [Ferruginivarius sediminum]RDD63864.1 hypothetical protein DRB17_01475 [Ferruginivarius sediminum]